MKPAPFDYVRPDSLGEACQLLAGDEDARLIAGGQTLVPMLAMRLARPAKLIDILRLPELAGIREEAGAVIVGATTRQAQAERERQARVILGESEMQIAASFAEASKSYVDNPTALHLRAMNMLFEGLKQKGALVIVPSSAVETMNLGGLSGMVSLAQNNLPKE